MIKKITAIIRTDALEEPLVDSVIATAHSGLPGDGIVAVAAVDDLYRIRDRRRLESLQGQADEDAGDTAAAADV